MEQPTTIAMIMTAAFLMLAIILMYKAVRFSMRAKTQVSVTTEFYQAAIDVREALTQADSVEEKRKLLPGASMRLDAECKKIESKNRGNLLKKSTLANSL